MKTKLFITALAIVAATTLASAQQGNGRGCGKCNGTGKGAAYVDNNSNGVCDNFENRKAGVTAKNTNTTTAATPQTRGNGQGRGRNYVDANKNGVCDTYEARTKE